MRKLLPWFVMTLWSALPPLAAHSATVWSEGFETDGNGTRYVTSVAECSDGSEDYLGRIPDGIGVGGGVSISGAHNDNWFGGQDLDAAGCPAAAGANVTITFSNINISGYADLEFLGLFGEDDDGSSQDWDDSDFVRIQYRVDGGAWKNLLAFEGTGGSNTEPLEDTDFDGTGDGRALTDTFTEWTNAIGDTGSSLDLRVEADLNSGDEDWGMDYLRILGTAASTPPTVTTRAVSNITTSTADAGGEVTDEGSASVTVRGVCWDTVANPDTTDACTTNGSGLGSFNSSITGLTPGQAYHVRAYATNSEGIAYGADVAFTAACFFAPVATAATSIQEEEFQAKWNAVSGASGYILDVATNSAFSSGGGGMLLAVDFETADDGYTPSATVGSGDTDVFNRTDVGNGSNDGFYWAAEDLPITDPSITLDAIDITGVTAVHFSIDFLTPNTEDWDTTDELKITYSVDGGADQNLMWVQSNEDGDAFNAPAAMDTDFDGEGDDGHELPALVDDFGAGVGTNFATFTTNAIGLSGTSMVIKLTYFGLTAEGEGLYVDNVTVSNAAGGSAGDFVPGFEGRALGAVTSATVTGLSAGVRYFYRVRATNDFCVSDYSNTQEVTTVTAGQDDTTAPSVSDLFVNGSTSVVDSALGSVELTARLEDSSSGLESNPAPSYVIRYPCGGTTESGDFTADFTRGETAAVTVTNVTALNAANWPLGTFTTVVTALDVSNNTAVVTNTFVVSDDDSEAPEHLEFTVDGAGGTSSSNLTQGSIAIIGYNIDAESLPETDEEKFAFVVLQSFPAGTVIDFSDNGWLTNTLPPQFGEFRTNESHFAQWVAPTDFTAGMIFQLPISNLNNDADQIVTYQSTPEGTNFIYAIYGGRDAWDDTASDNTRSALYPQLTTGFTALAQSPVNATYTGVTAGTASDLIRAISDSAHWRDEGDNVDLTFDFSNFTVNGAGELNFTDVEITDQQALDGGYRITNRVQDAVSGLAATGTALAPAPYFTLHATNGALIVSNDFVTPFHSGATNEQLLTMDAPTGVFAHIALGNASARVVASDVDAERTNDALIAPFVLTVAISDDDAGAPSLIDIRTANVPVNRLLHVTVGTNTKYVSGDNDTTTNLVTDGELAHLDADPLRITFGVEDYSGLARDAGATDTNAAVNLSIGSAISENFSNYVAAESAPATNVLNAVHPSLSERVAFTNVWKFDSDMPETVVDALWGTNEVSVTLPDTDNDRMGDTSTVYRLRLGRLIVEDDDVDVPILSSFSVRGTGVVVGTANDLFFSEYVEGSGNNKSIEIFNGTGADIDLNAGGYELHTFFNGETNFSGVVDSNGIHTINRDLLTGIITNGGVYVVSAQQATNTAAISNETHLFRTSATWFNGDDFVRLVNNCDASGSNCVVVDTLGRLGEDPGSFWGSGFNRTQDRTLRRKKSVTDGDTNDSDAFEPSNEWDAFAQDNFNNLGQHDLTNATGVTDQDVFLGTYTITGSVQDTESGIAVDAPAAPYYTVHNSTGGMTVGATVFSNRPAANGAARTNAEPLYSPVSAAASTNLVVLGTYTALVTVTDFDADRSNDDASGLLQITFQVVDDDTVGPNAPTGIAVSAHTWTNHTTFEITWFTNGVEDVSGVSHFRLSTGLAPPLAAADGFGVGLTNRGMLTNLTEGVATAHLFAVDNDGDRVDDAAKGGNTGFVMFLDLTAPSQVVIQSAAPGTNDEFSEIDVGWVAVPDAGIRAADGDPLAPWDAYVFYLTDDGTEPSPTNFAFRVRENDIPSLGSITQTNATITNLDLGIDYRIALVGLDEAGNQSPVSGISTVFIGGFSLTQGIHVVNEQTNGAHLAWTVGDEEPVTKAFDLIHVDVPSFHPGFHPSLTDEWQLVERVTNSFHVDTGTAVRLSPTELTDGRMRFYRAAREERWKVGQPSRIASREVYVAKTLELEPGENWVSLFFMPDSNTVAEVLGTNVLPATSAQATSTKIEWYGSTPSGGATNVLWLDEHTGWRFGGPPGPSFGSANDYPMPLNEGFNIIIDTTQVAETQELLLIGRVPLSNDVGSVYSIPLHGSGVYNVVSYNVPYRIELTNSGLREADFGGAPAGQQVNPNNSDELRVLQRGGGSLAAPKVRILMDQNGQFVFWSGGPFLQSAEFYRFEVDDTHIVRRRATGSNAVAQWNIELPYPSPGITMNP